MSSKVFSSVGLSNLLTVNNEQKPIITDLLTYNMVQLVAIELVIDMLTDSAIDLNEAKNDCLYANDDEEIILKTIIRKQKSLQHIIRKYFSIQY